ncbi:AraC family transcriptional regulator [Cohnella mopanensis]|uniref:AraC family transcriptional regulator n=1 Tax=Cohnella mopanensis TaxID=2911966 RepID=UPI001EF83F55|nr:AraC family transcriptional regulator [Cohnella mopanensis]
MLEFRFREKAVHGSSKFPLTIYNVNYESGNQQILPLHWHEEIELIYIRKGSAVFSVNHTDYTVREGDCVIVNSGELHSGYSHAPEGCFYSAIVFKLSWLSSLQPDRCQEYLNPLLKGTALFPALIQGDYGELCSLIKALIEDFHERAAGFELLFKGRLLIFLAKIYPLLVPRNRYEEANRVKSQKWNKIITVLGYMDARYKLTMTLEELAAVASMSPSHFCRLFKELTSLRPMEYLNLLRVNSAAVMIQSSYCSILDAALENGFQHLSYFSKQFKKHMHMTPSEYKSHNGKEWDVSMDREIKT